MRTLYELFGLGDRKAAQPDRVEQLEDRRVRADAEGEREDRDDGEARLEEEPPRAVAEVLAEAGEEDPPPVSGGGTRDGAGGGSDSFSRGAERGAGELLQRRSGARRREPPAGQQLRVAVVEVLRDLLDDRRLARRIEIRRPDEARADLRATTQAFSASVIRRIASTKAAQALCCRRSVFRPAAVNR